MRRAGSALLLALALIAGCENGGEASMRTAGDETARTEAMEAGKRPSGEQSHAGPRKHEGSPDRSRENGNATAPPRIGPVPTTHRSLPNEGTKRAAPHVPTAKGGDNSIQEFGVESPSAERVAATGVVKAYLDARAAGEWEQACERVSAGLKAEFLQFAAQTAEGKPASCATALRALTVEVPASALRTAAAIHVLSMRLEGSRAYLIYKNGDGTPMSIPMTQEGGEWKVAGLDGSILLVNAESLY